MRAGIGSRRRRLAEGGAGHEVTRPVDLHVTDVDACHVMPEPVRDRADRDPAAAAQIQQADEGGSRCRKAASQSPLWPSSASSRLSGRTLVIPSTDEITLISIVAHDTGYESPVGVASCQIA